jgi:uncharacterized protein (TIGR04222 family)
MRQRRPRWTLPVLAGLCLSLVLLFGGTAQAQTKDWSIANLDAAINVQQNGDVVVDETVTFNFQGNWHYIARDIPTSNSEGIGDIEVRDASGNVLPKGDTPGTYSAYKEGGLQYIQVNFDLTDTTATWTFHYRAKKVVLFFAEGDELRWYVLDAETPTTVGKITATVTLPGSVPSDSITHAVEADYGVPLSVSSPGPSKMVYQASNIPAFSKFWIVTGFPKGVVKYTWTVRRVAAFVIPKVGFLLPIIAVLAMLLIWRTRGRDDPGAVYASYVSEPPSTLSPGLAGALIDEKVDTKEVIATIVDLARRGYLEITDTAGHGILAKTDTIFTRTKSLEDLKGFEASVAKALFDSRHPDQVTSAQLKNHFYTHVDPIVGQVYVEVTSAGMFFGNPKSVRARWFGYGFLVAIILGVLTAIFALTHLTGWGWFLLGSIVAVIVVWVFAPHMPQRTPKGAQEQRRWEAFRNYLRDLTRFQDMASAKENYEKYLPYAIAFGVEKEWTRRFEDLTVASPTWYHPPVIVPIPGQYGPLGPGPLGPVASGGPAGGGVGGVGGHVGLPGGGFSLDSISDGLFRSLGNMSSVLTSVPSSAGGSSHGAFGGGGFSGGGFGGGFSGGGGGGGFHAG